MAAKRIRPENNKLKLAFAIVLTTLMIVSAWPGAVIAQSNEQPIAASYGTDQPGSFDIKVYQNYPNPFTGITSIKFETASFSNLKLAIFDQNGNLIKSYLYDNIRPGLHEVALDLNDIPSGEYSYRFTSGNYSQTYKMNVVR